MPNVYKPGQNAPVSGEYEIVGPRGGDTGKERTAIKGRPLPPTPKPVKIRRESRVTISPEKIAELSVKHLEMIQAVVARLASYGAALKNYCLTLTTAVCGFAITLQRPLVAALALLPIVIFAVLDAQYLQVERRLRRYSKMYGRRA
jgi:uncharacterized protein (DUF486 family)